MSEGRLAGGEVGATGEDRPNRHSKAAHPRVRPTPMVIDGHPSKRRRHTQSAASEHKVATLSNPSLPTHAAPHNSVTQTGVAALSAPPSEQSHLHLTDTSLCDQTQHHRALLRDGRLQQAQHGPLGMQHATLTGQACSGSIRHHADTALTGHHQIYDSRRLPSHPTPVESSATDQPSYFSNGSALYQGLHNPPPAFSSYPSSDSLVQLRADSAASDPVTSPHPLLAPQYNSQPLHHGQQNHWTNGAGLNVEPLAALPSDTYYAIQPSPSDDQRFSTTLPPPLSSDFAPSVPSPLHPQSTYALPPPQTWSLGKDEMGGCFSYIPPFLGLNRSQSDVSFSHATVDDHGGSGLNEKAAQYVISAASAGESTEYLIPMESYGTTDISSKAHIRPTAAEHIKSAVAPTTSPVHSQIKTSPSQDGGQGLVQIWKAAEDAKQDSHSDAADSSSSDDSEPGPLGAKTIVYALNNGNKPRKRFNESERQATSATRKMGTCLRCCAQKTRCVPNKENPTDPKLTCQSCLVVRWEYNKIRHLDVHCTREKMTKITLYRESGLPITDRWARDTKLHELTDWIETKTYRIKMDQGLCDKPFPLEVRQFRQRKGDKLYKRYIVETGKAVDFELPPYALADAAATSDRFLSYVKKNALAGLRHVATSEEDIHPIMRRTLQMAEQHCIRLASDVARMEKSKESASKLDMARKEATLMCEAIELWFAIRHMTGSSWISSGHEAIGILPFTDKRGPKRLHDKYLLPRMILEQFDRIQCNKILKPLRQAVVAKMDQLCKSSNPIPWFTVYMVTALFLYETAHTSADRHRHALENNSPGPYTLAPFVELLQHGAEVMLAHFMYYKGPIDMSNLTVESLSSGGFTESNMTDEEREYLSDLSAELNGRTGTHEEVEASWQSDDWHHDLYFVAQMFQPKYVVRNRYTQKDEDEKRQI